MSRQPPIEKVNLAEKFNLFEEHWSPKIAGEFVWHHHEAEDEMFLVVKGSMRMRLRDRDIEVGAGEFIIIPRGVEHMPVADEEAHVILFEPKTVLNTGNVTNERTRRELGRV